MKNKQPFLYFNFKNHQNEIDGVTFTNPVKVITTDEPEGVLPCLNEVQQAIDHGFYAAGYVAYEAITAFHTNIQTHHSTIPLLWFGIFNKPSKEKKPKKKPFHMTPWRPSMSVDEYSESFDRIHTYMNKGETKQVNFTIQMEAEFQGDSFAFYQQLERAQAANYSAYLSMDDLSILSASPELFFQMNDNTITTKPMKGTVGRGKTYEEDIENAKWLKNSQKNRLENELIIEVMKKDLAKIAIPQTISVPKQFEIEQYPTVYQMTSTVTAQVKEEKTIVDIFQALFPCGSITGFPKDRTMELISELEQSPRGIYCGAVGYFTPEQDAIFNVPIRTVVIDHSSRTAAYGVGGAIMSDSTKEEEYEEIITKAAVLTEKRKKFQLLESLGLENGQYIVLENHIKRLKQSAAYFNYSFQEQNLREKLQSIAKQQNKGNWKVRVLLDGKGTFSIEVEKMEMLTYPAPVILAKEPINQQNQFLYHKTTNRTIYNQHRKHQQDYFDVLLWNEIGQITEFTTGNIVIEMDGQLITPPVECGLLPGTFRQSLLDEGKVIERIITKQKLMRNENIWLINSVRKWVPVHLTVIE